MGDDAPAPGATGAVTDLLGLPSLGGNRYRVRPAMGTPEVGALYRTRPPDASLVITPTLPKQNGTQP